MVDVVSVRTDTTEIEMEAEDLIETEAMIETEATIGTDSGEDRTL